MSTRRLDPHLRHKPFCDGDAPTFRWKNGTAGWAEECDGCGAYARARPFRAPGVNGTDRCREPLPMLDPSTEASAVAAGLSVTRWNPDTETYEIKGETNGRS